MSNNGLQPGIQRNDSQTNMRRLNSLKKINGRLEKLGLAPYQPINDQLQAVKSDMSIDAATTAENGVDQEPKKHLN